VGFSIGTKGYIGTGSNVNYFYNDFWEYDPALNTWTQKAYFGGTSREGAVGFSIANKGYIGTGFDGLPRYDFWEYDPATDQWMEKANVGFIERLGGMGFSIGGNGYIGLGARSYWYRYYDFWKYDTLNDWWSQIADADIIETYGSAFTIGDKGYIVAGTGEMQAYDPATNTWANVAAYPGGQGYASTTAFNISDKGYIGAGYGLIGCSFWEYTPGPPVAAKEAAKSPWDVSVFPNPAVNTLFVNSPAAGNKPVIATVINSNGKIVICTRLAVKKGIKSSIDVSSLPSGMYFLQLKWEGETVTRKFVRE
jgi:hypothetical protein